MKKVFKKIINPTTVLIVLFFIDFYLLNRGLTALDDIVYQNAFYDFPTCLNWISEFYQAWSGRITLSILINIFMNLPMQIFKITNSFVFIMIVVTSYKIITILKDDWKSSMKNILLVILFCSIFFISIPVMNSGGLWLAGAMNYLWPFAGMLIAMIPFIKELKGKSFSKKNYILFILASFLGGFAEQTSAILVSFGLITIIWLKLEKKKISKLLMLHYIIIVVLTLVNLFAPGNTARTFAEEIKWYPSYGMLSISDKLVQGYIQVANHLINHTTLLFSIVAVLSSYFILTNQKIKKINKYIAILPILYVVLRVFPFNTLLGRIVPGIDIDGILYNTLFSFERFNIETFNSHTVLLQLISSSTIIGIIAGQFIYLFKDKKTGIIIAILYCASICSALALSFSPSIYASGNRIYLATDFLLVMLSSFLWIELLQKLRNNGNIVWKILLVMIIVLAIVLYINIYINGINMIIY